MMNRKEMQKYFDQYIEEEGNSFENCGKLYAKFVKVVNNIIKYELAQERQQLHTKIKEVMEGEYHYWRECHNCGYASNEYLHCMHDKVQTQCHSCGETLGYCEGDCNCDFTIKLSDLSTAIDKIMGVMTDEEIKKEWEDTIKKYGDPTENALLEKEDKIMEEK